jgi:phosphopantothenoylcysteine decarboxylase / phosphopantothenate---cysteine ligase
MTPLEGRNVVLCVCGSIAAYKAADLTSKLVQAGAVVDVILSQAAREFVTPFTFRSLTGREVYGDMFAPVSDAGEEHVALARRADIVIVAPATANTLAKLAHGLADDMTALTVLATTAPLLIAPAMDAQMWAADATQSNVKTLQGSGATLVGPEAGRLASGHMGLGRLADTETIIGAAKLTLARGGDLAGRRIVVSAGGTREPLDPVRFITNSSSGKQGYALAEAARDRGASVTLISAPVGLPVPYGVQLVPIETVDQLYAAVMEACLSADALVMAAAVSDFKPATVESQKIKKRPDGGLTIDLVKTVDVLAAAPSSVVKVGFAAETQELLQNAAKKLVEKNADLICANDVSATDAGFAVDNNRVTILDREGGREEIDLAPKYDVAMRILDRMVSLIEQKHPRS